MGEKPKELKNAKSANEFEEAIFLWKINLIA